MGIKVRATKEGIYGHIRSEGDEFEIANVQDFSFNWMESLDPSFVPVKKAAKAKPEQVLEFIKVKLAELEESTDPAEKYFATKLSTLIGVAELLSATTTVVHDQLLTEREQNNVKSLATPAKPLTPKGSPKATPASNSREVI